MRLNDDIAAQIDSRRVECPVPAADRLDRLFPRNDDASVLVVTCHASDYSASRIARAVEDCDAHLLNLNVTAETRGEGSWLTVELRVSVRNAASVARSLERYGYSVVAFSGPDAEGDDDTLRRRVNELLRYIDP